MQRRHAVPLVLQKIPRRAERPDAQAREAKKTGQSITNVRISVDDQDDGLLLRRSLFCHATPLAVQ
jgi:hypothetical protein